MVEGDVVEGEELEGEVVEGEVVEGEGDSSAYFLDTIIH